MYELTIATDAISRTTRHADPAGAHDALLAHAVGADLYLHAHPGRVATPTPNLASVIALLRLDPAHPQPLRVGTATIAAAATDTRPHRTGAATS